MAFESRLSTVDCDMIDGDINEASCLSGASRVVKINYIEVVEVTLAVSLLKFLTRRLNRNPSIPGRM